jgi:long-chain fatty acid transport protein
LTGDHNQNNNKLLVIPALSVSANPGKLLNDRLAFGLAVNAPFGLTTSFPSIGMGRYTGWKNYLKMVGTTMAGAVKLHEKLSVGAGATNYWAYKYGQYLNYPNANILGIPGTPDGRAWIDSNGYGWGWNFGILAKPHPKHRFGFSFRSKADVNVHGQVKIDDLVLGLAQGYDTAPHFVSGAHSQLHLPQNFTWGYAYVPSNKWAVEFDFALTGWSIFKDQDYEFDRNNATLRALGTIPRDYSDTFSFNMGGHYQANKKTDLQAGFFFYEAAAPKNHFDNFLPDANRFGWTWGTSYQITDWLRLDAAYLFILYATRHISNPQIPAKGGENIDGRYTSILHGAFLSFNCEFDFPGERRIAIKEAIPQFDVDGPPALG